VGEATGFLKYDRQELEKQPVSLRVKHWKEFIKIPADEVLQTQGARCMECGVPFCHWACPVGNLAPEWNDLVYRGAWEQAFHSLRATNNFPEFTGRVCPAPCEDSCVLAISKPAVTIKNIELAIIEKAFQAGWLKPQPPAHRTGKTVAVIGSGPAGLACADQLNKLGHSVTVYEKSEDVGGLLTIGIPDFKLEKQIVQRRVRLMEEEGIVFRTGTHVGVDISAKYIRKEYHAVVLAGGAEECRELEVPGRELKGVYQAMQYLSQQNRVQKGQRFAPDGPIDAHGKNVVVLGGGDTGADCVGTANRQGAKSVRQFEILSCPPKERTADNPWPEWARIHRKASSHEEGVELDYEILTKSLSGQNGLLEKLHTVRLEYGAVDPQSGRPVFREVPNSHFTVDCNLLILAMGFLGPVKRGMLEELKVELDARGNVKTDANCMTSVPGIFSAGDMRRGQSWVVWAIHEGRAAAQGVQRWLSQSCSISTE
jgi:glutamate synthase (NADPH) small chain